MWMLRLLAHRVIVRPANAGPTQMSWPPWNRAKWPHGGTSRSNPTAPIDADRRTGSRGSSIDGAAACRGTWNPVSGSPVFNETAASAREGRNLLAGAAMSSAWCGRTWL